MTLKVDCRITIMDERSTPENTTKELKAIRSLITKGFSLMARKQDDLQESLDAMDAATTAIGERIETLIGKIENDTIEDADLEEARAIVARLKVLGNPGVPVEPVTPGEPVTPPTEPTEPTPA